MSGIGTTGHALRRLFVTTLANDPRVSVEAAMRASRHTSVADTVPTKFWAQNLTKGRLRHLVWTAKSKGGELFSKELARGAVITLGHFSQPEQPMIPGGGNNVLKKINMNSHVLLAKKYSKIPGT